MLTIGCHLSKRRGYLEMAKEAASINANTFQYFTRSPRGSEQAALDEKDVRRLSCLREGAWHPRRAGLRPLRCRPGHGQDERA